MHQTSGRWRLGLALSLLTVVLWGILPVALKVTLQALDVYTVTWFRFVVSFALLAVYLAMRGTLPIAANLGSASGKLLAIAIIFLVVFKEQYTLHQWIGVSVLTLGFILFFNEQLTNLITGRGEYLLGSGLIVLGAVTWAIYA